MLCPSQGDKFMRLPSQNYNTKDLIRNMSIADGPEVVVDAEEYLHPQSFCPEPAEPQPEPEADAVKVPLTHRSLASTSAWCRPQQDVYNNYYMMIMYRLVDKI